MVLALRDKIKAIHDGPKILNKLMEGTEKAVFTRFLLNNDISALKFSSLDFADIKDLEKKLEGIVSGDSFGETKGSSAEVIRCIFNKFQKSRYSGSIKENILPYKVKEYPADFILYRTSRPTNFLMHNLSEPRDMEYGLLVNYLMMRQFCQNNAKTNPQIGSVSTVNEIQFTYCHQNAHVFELSRKFKLWEKRDGQLIFEDLQNIWQILLRLQVIRNFKELKI